MAQNGGNTVPRITRAEHIGPNDTGDNIEAKRVAQYAWNGLTWERSAANFHMGASYDYTAFSNPDANGNYQTITYKLGGSGGTTVRVLSLTYDGNNNVTSITKS